MGDKQVTVGNRGKMKQVCAVGLLDHEEPLGRQADPSLLRGGGHEEQGNTSQADFSADTMVS